MSDDAPWSIAVDRGGTFTDVVATSRTGRVVVRKVPTPNAADDGDTAVAAIREIVGADAAGAVPRALVHSVRCGTTVATNALLERRGERSALLVTAGFRDLLRIGSGERPDLFALAVRRAPQLPELVFEIDERVLADGTVRTPLDASSVLRAAESVRAAGIESVAVVFLHAYAAPAHELRAGELLRAAGIAHVALSHEVAREVKVVPRGATAAADAYLTPLLRRSLARFRAAFADDVDVRFMQSHGGLCDVAHAAGPRAVLSGPAGGVVATAAVARIARAPRAIGFDMGGTSTDVSRWAGEEELVYETRAAGLRLRVPALRVETVAAGGGSRLDCDGRRLRVGPGSVGADPGPAGYGRGGSAALTDANAVLGRLLPASFPRCFGGDGRSAFDVDASRRALAALADRAGLGVEEAALGFVRVAVERMAQAIREVSVQRGHDVRDHALVCFGGAGAQHACALARALGMRRVLVHPLGSVLSAWGIGNARSAHDEAHALLGTWDDDARGAAGRACGQLAARGRARLASEGVDAARVRCDALVELRYRGVDHTLAVPLGDVATTADVFHAMHRRLYGFARPGAALELVGARVRTSEVAEDGAAPERSVARFAPPTRELPERTRIWWEGPAGAAPLDVPVHALGTLSPGDALAGPALLVDDVTTLWLEPGFRLHVDASGVCVLEAHDVVAAPQATTACDPVHLALFANAFMSVAERMGAVLERVSHSTSIKERLDFSCALFDAAGRLVANAPHIPVHLGAMGESVRAAAAARGADLRDGDALLTNDPYAGGSHLPDLTLVTPVLVAGGVPRFFVANRAHHGDVGGISPGSMPPLSRTLADEGVRLHDVLVVRDGVFDEERVRAVFAEGEHPARGLDERVQDLRAQCAANAEGARLLRALVEQHGADVVAAYMGHVLDDGEAAMRELAAALPPGTHAAADALDDGTPLRVAVTAAAHGIVVDFDGTGPRSAGNLNTPRAVTRAAVLYALRLLVPRALPLNEGCLRPVDVRIPAGSLLDPRAPDAVVGGNVETSQRLVDLVLRALGACAAGQGTMNNVTFGRADGRGGAYYETICGGSGAGPGFDGECAVQVHMTNTRITDPEVLELRWPVVVRRFAVRDGSGGAGRQRGGDGAVREIEFLEPLVGGVLSERRAHGAPGLGGGGAGAPGRNVLVHAGRETALPGRAAFVVAAGDVLRVETPGGGGFSPSGPGSDPGAGGR